MTLNYDNKKILLLKLLEVLNKLQIIGYTYRDLTVPNIGYKPDENGDVKNYIVLDHDASTILDIKSEDTVVFFDGMERCDWTCAGTYPPYYVIDDFINDNKNWKQRLDKLSVLGLAAIIIQLFYGDVGTKKIIGGHFLPAYDAGKPYEGIKILYDNHFSELKADIQTLIPLYSSNSDDLFLKSMITSLLMMKYEDIPTFKNLLSDYAKQFKL